MMLLVVLAVLAIVGTAAYCMVCERIAANNVSTAVDSQRPVEPVVPAPAAVPAQYAQVQTT